MSPSHSRPEPAPQTPSDIPRAGWISILRRSVKQFKHDDVTDRAAALTYFGVLAIFPGLLVLVSILGLLGTSTTQSVLDNLRQVAPGGVNSFLRSVIEQVKGRRTAAGIGAVIGILVALWSASGYVAAFMRASNAIYDVDEGRPIWKTAPVRLGTTIALVIMLVASAVMVVVTGPVASQIGQALGVGNTAVTVWNIAKWPVLLIIVGLILAILFWASPNAKHGFQWVSPGGFIAVVLWLIASALFAVYVANFSHYNKIYGSLAGVIIFLIWMWISNVAILLGAEFNAELERGRAMAAGHPADEEPFSELRDDRKLRKKEKGRSRS